MRDLGRRIFRELWPQDAVEWALGVALFVVLALCVLGAASEIYAAVEAGAGS